MAASPASCLDVTDVEPALPPPATTTLRLRPPPRPPTASLAPPTSRYVPLYLRNHSSSTSSAAPPPPPPPPADGGCLFGTVVAGSAIKLVTILAAVASSPPLPLPPPPQMGTPSWPPWCSVRPRVASGAQSSGTFSSSLAPPPPSRLLWQQTKPSRNRVEAARVPLFQLFHGISRIFHCRPWGMAWGIEDELAWLFPSFLRATKKLRDVSED